MAGFVDLIAWREAVQLAAEVEAAVKGLKGISSLASARQMTQAAESISANLAEGYGRGHTPDAMRFHRFARGSADELESRLRSAAVSKRLPEPVVEPLVGHTRRVRFLVIRYMGWVEEQIKKKGTKGTKGTHGTKGTKGQ